jgi:SAM-dependent methyltransferase
MIAGDRAGKAHWDDTWRSLGASTLTQQVDGPGRWNHVNREVARFLRRWLTPRGVDSQLVELGCARSIWLPYFAQLGHSITGVDYSELGCELARTGLAQAGTPGRVVLGDFFNPPPDLVGRFDAAFSNGVAEHFDNTKACIEAFGRFLAPRGRLVTIVPNMTGVPGFLQKQLNRPVYEKHVPLDSTQLRQAHVAAGLEVLDAGYLISTNFGVLNLTGLPTGNLSWAAKRVLLAALGRVSLLGWLAEPRLRPVQPWAGYVYCVADRPDQVRRPS